MKRILITGAAGGIGAATAELLKAQGAEVLGLDLRAGEDAYTMSKCGVVGYSEALRLEYANALEVTTFYPGYVRTPIHDESNEFGVTLERMVPEESLDDCARALAAAAAGIRVHLARQARRGSFAGNPLGVRFADRLLRRTASSR